MGHRRRYSKRDTGGMKLAFRASPGHSQLVVAVVNAACPSAVQLCMTERRQKSLPYEIASGGVSMTNPIAWFVELTVKPGALARFENLTGEMIAATRADAGVLAYQSGRWTYHPCRPCCRSIC
jgi:hypothetical protein